MKPALSTSFRGRNKAPQKSRENLLFFTGAAVQALSTFNGNHEPGETSVSSGVRASKHVELLDSTSTSSTGSLGQEQRDVIALGANVSSSHSSSQSTGSSDRTESKTDTSFLDGSFDRSSAQRVRIPARLLREIKSPQDRNTNSTGNDQRGIQQPAALVVRHVDGPSAWVSMATPTSSTEDVRMTCTKPVTSTKTVFTHEVTQVKDLRDEKNPFQKSSSVIQETQSGDIPGSNNGNNDEEVDNPATSVLKKGNYELQSGLYQGDPITGGFMTNTKHSNSTKAKSFSLSERERVLKEEFLKRKDRKSAPVKRLVQPTVIPSKEEKASSSKPESASQDPVVSAAAIAAAAASAATAPFLQIQHGLESQISALVSSLNVLHEQQAKLEHRKVVEQEHKLQEQLDERLKKLEEVQKQILESQNSQTHTQPRHPPRISDVPYSQPSALVRSSSAYCVSSSATSDPVTTYQGNLMQPLPTTVDDQKPPVPYVPAAHHFTQRAVHTQTASTKKDALSKFKLVKNTRTQTSPQDSSLLSSDSPLQTPLPRKRPPLPMSRDSLLRSHAKELRYTELPREKRVHFDDPGLRQSQPYNSFAEIQSNPKHLVMTKPNTHLQTFHTQRENIQEKEKLQPSDTREVVDDLSRIKKDLKSVMMETEKIKDNLSLQKMKAEIEQSFSQANKGPCPLDAYLSLSETSRPAERTVIDKLAAAPVVEHYTDAERILRNVQMKRNNLESNLNAIMRQTDDEHVYAGVDSMIQQAQGVETLRIRKDVDRIIKEINMTVKKEIEVECKSSEVHSEPTIATSQDKKMPKAKYQQGTALSKRQPRKMLGKENVPDPKTTTKKPKPTVKPSSARMKTSVKPEPKQASKPVSKPVPKPAPPTRPQTYLTSVYGRQPYHAQRITSKAPYLHYQSPVNPRTAALTSAILGAGSRVQSKPVHQETPKPIHTRNEEPTPRNKPPRYYFHPDMDMSHVVPSGEGRLHLDTPVEGHLVPMAIPLGKPKTDQSLRLPLTTASSPVRDTAPQPSPVPHKKPSPSKPNVAVITIRDEEAGNDSTNRKKKKGKGQTTRRADLGVQILPPMDIDSLTESSDSVLTPPRHVDHVSDISEPFTRPDDSDYDDFRNYLTVRDTRPEIEEKDDDDEVPRIPTPENPLTIEGHTEKECMYHGPPFPPQHPPLPSNTHPGVLEADNRVNTALEDRAVEWVEQELLARIVSEMNQPLPDPTLAAKTPPESSPESSVVTDDGNMLAASIGLGGIRLFVDAGIPVDRDFVAELIRDVIAEQIISTLGYPKPTATPRQPQEDVPEGRYSPEPAATPVSTPLPTPVYTPVESEASEPHSPAVTTPGPSPIPSEPSYTTESEEETTPVKEVSEAKEKSDSEVSEARSPVPTPVATPSGSHSTATSVSTPEPSTREPESKLGSPLSTPQATERTPSPPPEPSTISTPPVESSVTTPKPPTVTSYPSSMTTSTLSTPGTTSTMTTIDEELSEGQLLQPYVHMGQYSEGEYTAALSPGVGRKIPDETLDVLGKDQDSRNQLIRVALHGLLRRSHGSSSSTTSTGSTLKDTDDIREDSLVDYAHSEGEIIFPRNLVPVSYARTTARHGQTGGPDSTSSEGELVSIHRSHGTSPGELKPVFEPNMSPHSPGEISTRPDVKRSHLETGANREVVNETASPDNTESRSLHASDLHRKERNIMGPKQSIPNEHIHEGEEPELNNQGINMPSTVKETIKTIDVEVGEPSSRPPPIHVPIPPMDDSSLNSEERPGYDHEDTYGNVSSISGGDF